MRMNQTFDQPMTWMSVMDNDDEKFRPMSSSRYPTPPAAYLTQPGKRIDWDRTMGRGAPIPGTAEGQSAFLGGNQGYEMGMSPEELGGLATEADMSEAGVQGELTSTQKAAIAAQMGGSVADALMRMQTKAPNISGKAMSFSSPRRQTIAEQFRR